MLNSRFEVQPSFGKASEFIAAEFRVLTIRMYNGKRTVTIKQSRSYSASYFMLVQQ